MRRPKIGILIGPKGRGSNMRAIIEACQADEIPADVAVVVSPKPDTQAVAAAESLGVRVAVIEPGENYGDDLLDALDGCELVCLAGFLRLLPESVLRAFPRRILNIHPALLPMFGGKGMYGMHVHEAVRASGVLESGCTVHFVSDVYDEGEIILQMKCPVFPQDTPEQIAERVLALEHKAYPAAIRQVLSTL